MLQCYVTTNNPRLYMSDEIFIPNTTQTNPPPSRKLFYAGVVGFLVLIVALGIASAFVWSQWSGAGKTTTDQVAHESNTGDGAPPISAEDMESTTPPNIVVILTDDQDVASLATMPKTRDLIAKEGVTFDNSYADFSLCCPSRTSWLTGLAAHNHGVLSNKGGDDPRASGGYEVFLEKGHVNKQIGPWFQNAGYVAGLMGKILNGYGIPSPSTDPDPRTLPTYVMPGWNEWRALRGQSYFGYNLNNNGVLEHFGQTAADYSTDVLAGEALSFINTYANKPKPFFLLLTPNAPHSSSKLGAEPAPRHAGDFATLPLPMSPNFNEADVSDKPAWVRGLKPLDVPKMTSIFRNRRESLLAVDEMVERIVTRLSAKGVLDNTYIIFTSDNGYAMGAHRWESKIVPYEESIRVPLMMRGPGIPTNENRGQLVNNLDVVATILDWAGVTPPPGNVLDGRSLRPVIANPTNPWRTALLVQGRDGPFPKLSIPHGFFFAVVTKNNDNTKNYAYIENDNVLPYGLEKELYDLTADPFELTNRADDIAYQPVVDFLHDVLIPLSTCTGDSCWYDTPITFSTAPLSTGAIVKPAVYQGAVTPSYALDQQTIEDLEN